MRGGIAPSAAMSVHPQHGPFCQWTPLPEKRRMPWAIGMGSGGGIMVLLLAPSSHNNWSCDIPI
eukprot:CAMPEP_0174315414 /NCGR_PEP_ID=MMETSP0810-20121108/6275_1 /TAXON_ID=73025 ORGANISM="Eutreptiella gymnastica-like, Strain CCMP1594" /NCGR_SAMPLE_ID=MMETSP0810 /ASSEMBLY_ACC=CAM_ASM_000659 /LENGTH=63 /DNA_ID=CAMNT_0015424801 /DNA_START=511 /DNA_END=702 /DNA_ORIENTATION=+